jgi:hypothetical protein
MDSTMRFKTRHSDGNQDEGGELVVISPFAVSSEAPQFLFEPKMSSLFFSFCDFQELLALRSMNKALKGSVDQECIDRALKAFPLFSTAGSANRVARGGEVVTGIKVMLGWKNSQEFSRETLLNRTLELAEGGDHVKALQNKFDKDLKQKAKENLRTIGHFDTKDMDDGETNGRSKEYIQRPYVGYTKYPLTYQDQEPDGWGGAFTYEESISLEKAMMLVKMMLWSLRETESLGNLPTTYKPHGEQGTEFSVLVQHLKCLFMMACASCIQHGYLAYNRRNPFPSRGRSGSLQFRLSTGQEIIVGYLSVSHC